MFSTSFLDLDCLDSLCEDLGEDLGRSCTDLDRFDPLRLRLMDLDLRGLRERIGMVGARCDLGVRSACDR